jgi:hypothetical protein
VVDSASLDATIGRLVHSRVSAVLLSEPGSDPSATVSSSQGDLSGTALVLSFCARSFQPGQIPRLVAALIASIRHDKGGGGAMEGFLRATLEREFACTLPVPPPSTEPLLYRVSPGVRLTVQLAGIGGYLRIVMLTNYVLF